MIIHWDVVLDDGTRPYAPDVVVDQRRSLHLVVGEDVTIDVSVIDPVGGDLKITAPDFLILDARTASHPVRKLFSVRSTVVGRVNRIVITSDSTKVLLPQRGTYDLFAIRGSVRSCLIPLSALELAPSALGRNYL